MKPLQYLMYNGGVTVPRVIPLGVKWGGGYYSTQGDVSWG